MPNQSLLFDFQIKICGISNPTDAQKAVEFGADAIGLNFYQRSLRSVTVDKAQRIGHAIGSSAKRVGVFVNEPIDSMTSIVDSCELDFIQLHGDEAPNVLSQCDSRFIRAVRVTNFDSVRAEIDQWVEAGVIAILLDAASGRQYGGTGKQLDWGQVANLSLPVPLILAGGLDCDNVSQAISIARPAAVDVASGIEKFPGSKDHEQMRTFITAAKAEFAR